MAHFCLVEVNKLTFRVIGRWNHIHDEQVHIAVFEHMSQFLIHQAELLLMCVPRYLNDKH